jgi:hypothetical protein
MTRSASCPRTLGALLDPATGTSSLSPPAERGERVGERGTNAMARQGHQDFPAGWASSPQPSPPEEERKSEASADGSVEMRPDLGTLRNVFGQGKMCDSSGRNKLTAKADNYYETSHYRPVVARSIMAEIYLSSQVSVSR